MDMNMNTTPNPAPTQNPAPQYKFCPRCGAVMQNGICQSCGYSVQPNPGMQPNAAVPPMYMESKMGQEKKSHTGLIIGIVIGCVVFALVIVIALIACLMPFYKKTLIDEGKNEYINEEVIEYSDEDENLDDEDAFYDESSDDEEDVTEGSDWIDLDGDGIGELEYGNGAEGLSAEWYESITDYIRHDLSYSVTFQTSYDEDIYCNYPYLSGNKDFLNGLNEGFAMIAESTQELAEEYDAQATLYSYVTYMDEDLMSVVCIESYDFGDDTYFDSILCFTFDMQTGDLISFELDDTNEEFMDELEKRCTEQSTADASYLFSEYTEDELWKIMKEDFALVAFYTPLGMEIGINYDGCWCCATFKDYEKYIKQIVE